VDAARQKPIATWSAGEVAAVVSALNDEPMWSALYRLALTTGMRPGKLRALRWRDLDLDRGAVVVARTMTKDADGVVAVGDSTKTGRRRAVALPASTVAALTRWRAAQNARRLAAETWAAEPFVFDRGDGTWLPLTTWQHRHDRLIAATGAARITLHGLRHTYATLMLEGNAHPKIVADALGHVDVGTTLNIYSHASDAIQRAAADALEQRLFGGGDATIRPQQQRK
jgi:integrase